MVATSSKELVTVIGAGILGLGSVFLIEPLERRLEGGRAAGITPRILALPPVTAHMAASMNSKKELISALPRALVSTMRMAMKVSSAITDPGFREYVKNQVPKLADIKPIVQAMHKHGFVEPDRFRLLVKHDSVPYLITATGPNITEQQFALPKRWWGFPNSSSTVLNIDPETMADFDNPARLSSFPSKSGSKRKVYLAGLAILQGILVDGHQLAKSFDHDFISTSWVKFELDVYQGVIDGWEGSAT